LIGTLDVGSRAVFWVTLATVIAVLGFCVVVLIRDVFSGDMAGGFIFVGILSFASVVFGTTIFTLMISLCANSGVELVMRFYLPVRRMKNIGRKISDMKQNKSVVR